MYIRDAHWINEDNMIETKVYSKEEEYERPFDLTIFDKTVDLSPQELNALIRHLNKMKRMYKSGRMEV